MTKREQIARLQADLELYDEVRDSARNALRELLTLDSVVGRNPVRFRALYDLTVSAAAEYMKQIACLTSEITKLDHELTALCRPQLQTPDILTAIELEDAR